MVNLTHDVLFLPSAIVTESASMASKPSSEKMKLVTERFIRFLSTQQHPPHWPCLKDHSCISDNERELLKELFSNQMVEKLEQCSETLKAFRIVGRGKHNTVWMHESFPHIVFKLMDSEAARKQEEVAQKAREVTREMAQSWVQLPRTATIETEKVTIYVEERLPLILSMQEHEEFWARVLTHYQSTPSSSLFNQNLEKLIGNTKTLIERVGFWDVGYHNLPEVRIDGAGVCGTDFENVDLTGKNKAEGIQRLAHLVPVSPLVDDIINSYEKEMPNIYANQMKNYNSTVDQYTGFNWGHMIASIPKPTELTIREEFNETLEEKRAALKALQTALQEYDRRGSVTGHEALISCGKFSSLNEEENKLAQQLLEEISIEFSKIQSAFSLKPTRSIHLQPGCGLGKIEAALYTHDRFLKALNALKEQGVVLSWSDNYMRQKKIEYTQATSYTIYF